MILNFKNFLLLENNLSFLNKKYDTLSDISDDIESQYLNEDGELDIDNVDIHKDSKNNHYINISGIYEVKTDYIDNTGDPVNIVYYTNLNDAKEELKNDYIKRDDVDYDREHYKQIIERKIIFQSIKFKIYRN
jgi:hypothetical protein